MGLEPCRVRSTRLHGVARGMVTHGHCRCLHGISRVNCPDCRAKLITVSLGKAALRGCMRCGAAKPPRPKIFLKSKAGTWLRSTALERRWVEEAERLSRMEAE